MWRELLQFGRSQGAASPRRRAARCAYANALLWAVGNGLVGSTLIIFLAAGYGAKGMAVSLILAAPHFVGLLRLTAPAWIRRLGDRKRFCLICYAASFVLLACVPFSTRWGLSEVAALSLLISLWSLYHLFEYLGTVALWSWLGDVVPGRLRGRFLGYRERYMLWGRVAGMGVGIAASALSNQFFPHLDPWIGYAAMALTGVAMMFLSLEPLAAMPALEPQPRPVPPTVTRQLPQWLDALRDGPFRRLLFFAVWIGAVNGLTQAPQNLFPIRVLGLSLAVRLSMDILLRLGQSAAGPYCGGAIDRWGNRRVLIVSQVLAALGLVFFLPATADQWSWIVGAWVFWIAYVGLNVGLPSLMLKLSPGGDSPAYVAVYFAFSGLFYGLGSVAGGAVFDWLDRPEVFTWLAVWGLDRYRLMFIVGLILRLLSVAWLLRLIEEKEIGGQD